jgi:hypothetical protein
VGGAIGGDLVSTLNQLLTDQGQLSERNLALRSEQTREIFDRARTSSLEEARAALAARGIAATPGVEQGQETAAIRRISERIDPQFFAALRDVAIDESGRADERYSSAIQAALGLTGLEEARAAQGRELTQGQFLAALSRSVDLAGLAEGRFLAGLDSAEQFASLGEARLLSALGLATGLSDIEARTLLDTLGQATNRQAILSDIALQTLTQNRLWNQFLAEFGLEREAALAQLQSDQIAQVMAILQQFGSFVDAARGGEVRD